MRYNPRFIRILGIFCVVLLLSAILFNYREGLDASNVDYYVISMKREDRMKNIETQQSKMRAKLNIFPAVDGDKIDMNNVEDQTVADAFKDSTKHRKREIGCFLSHYYVYKMIERNGKSDGYTVVLEDDFNITVDNFEEIILETLNDKDMPDFDILYVETISKNHGDPLIKNVSKMDRETGMWGTQGYIVKNSNIMRILENTQTIDMPIDWKLITAIHADKIVAYTFWPFLTKSVDGLSSTITEPFSFQRKTT